MIRVHGQCPMGCGPTLVLIAGGYIACSSPDCAAPAAVHVILADQETEHLVAFERDDFKIKHPLRERINNELLNCALHTHIGALSGPPVPPGTYRAHAAYTLDGSRPVWTYTPIEPGL